MSTLNPFLEDDISKENNVTQEKDSFPEELVDHQQKMDLTVDTIAEELLKNKFILTALEFYTEIQERGKDLSRLRNYFSNPSNFEMQISVKDTSGNGVLYRTGSTSTFDSLDMARYSDDGAVQSDEKIAVLEFELRKAKDTIKSLRNNLTKTAEKEPSCLNENSDTDNSEKKIFSSFRLKVTTEEIKPLEMRAINHLVNEYLLNHGYKLSSITFSDENEDQDFEDWDDVGINTPKPPELLTLYRNYNHHILPSLQKQDISTMTEDNNIVDDSIEKSENETHLLKIEVLQNEIDTHREESRRLQSEIDSLKKELLEAKKNIENLPAVADIATPHPAVSSNQETPTQKIQVDEINEADVSFCYRPNPSRMSELFWNALVAEAQLVVEESWLKDEVLNISRTANEVVGLLARSLPHIVPTVLLAKRDQLIPLLLSTAALHHDLAVRNELLHILFNLIKKPDDVQRQFILHGCTAYAKHVGSERTEEELLPQCWEQLGHKYPERRQLVAEACGTIAPYLRSEMRGSLLVSILHQMQQEEKTDLVRCSVVKSLALIYAFLEDDSKYTQALELLQSFLRSDGEAVKETAYRCLLPSFAVWSLKRNTLHSHLLDLLLKNLEKVIEEQKDDACNSAVAPIMYLLPYLFAAVLLEMKMKENERSSADLRSFNFKRDLENPSIIIGDQEEFNKRLIHFDSLVSAAKIDADSQVLLWVTHQFVPRLLKLVKDVQPSHEETVTSLTEMTDLFCNLFGKHYVKEKVAPQFTTALESREDDFSTSLLPVYVASVFTQLEDDRAAVEELLFTAIVRLSRSKLSLESMQVTLALLRCKAKYQDTILQVLWSSLMHESALVRAAAASLFVVMTTTHIDETVLSSRVLPALITLSSDMDINVRIATIPSFCYVMINPTINIDSVDRVITQLTEIVSSSVESSYEEHSQDGTMLGLHSVRQMLITTSTRIGATVHPKFRDEFILPHLVAIAASNNQVEDASKRSITSLDLLEAYNCLSCCFLATTLLQGSVLPALKCLLTDMEALHPDHVNNVTTLINEVERKLEHGSVTSDSSPQLFHTPITPPALRLSGSQISHAVTSSADDAKRMILNTFDQITKKNPKSPNLFSWKKSS